MTHVKPWLKQYEPGVPETIDPDSHASLVSVLDDAFRRHAGKDMMAYLGSRWTFAEVDALSRHLAAWLQALKLAKGARVAVMMPNIPHYAVAIAGILRAGHAVVNVNPMYTPRELEHQLVDSGAEVIIVLGYFGPTVQEVIERTPVKHILLASLGD